MRLFPLLIVIGACGGNPSPPPETATPLATASATASATAPPVTTAPPANTANDKRPTEVPGSAIRFVGGDGTAVESAILIKGAHGEADGTASEYQYLAMVYGPQNTAWKLERQALLSRAGKQYDAMAIVLADGTKKTVYFDISEYFGKF
jgi:hypothetical protein